MQYFKQNIIYIIISLKSTLKKTQQQFNYIQLAEILIFCILLFFDKPFGVLSFISAHKNKINIVFLFSSYTQCQHSLE